MERVICYRIRLSGLYVINAGVGLSSVPDVSFATQPHKEQNDGDEEIPEQPDAGGAQGAFAAGKGGAAVGVR